jgi:hypothetical protein
LHNIEIHIIEIERRAQVRTQAHLFNKAIRRHGHNLRSTPGQAELFAEYLIKNSVTGAE